MTQKLGRWFSSYPVYFAVGSCAAAAAIGVRAIAGQILDDSTVMGYISSMLCANAVGIAVSYTLNSRFTFAQNRSRPVRVEMMYFLATSLVGMILSTGIATGLREALHWGGGALFYSSLWIAQFAKLETVIFALAVLLVSFFTYFSNKFITFR